MQKYFFINTRVSAAAVVALILGVSASSWAEELLEEMTITATRGTQSATDSVNAISVVGSERMQELQPTLITDALRGAPGVFIQQTTPGQGTAIVRGLKGSEILHLVDGMRLNNALFRNAPNQYLALVDPWIISRAEVVRGPLSSLYGSDAMGGVVHLISSRPSYSGPQFTTQYRGRLSLDSATLGETLSAAVSLGNEHFSSGVALGYLNQEDVRAADRRTQAPTAYRARSASIFVNYHDPSWREWDFSIQYLEQPDTPRYDELVPGFGQTEAASQQFSFSPNSRLFIHGVHRSSGYSPWLDKLEVHLGLQHMRDGRRTQDGGSTRIRTEDNRSSLHGLTVQGISVPFGRHQFSYGLDTYYDQVKSSRREFETTTNESEEISSRFPNGSTLQTVDVYFHDQIDLSPNANLEAGIRASHARVDLAATASSSAAKISNTDVSGSVGLRYAMTDRLDGIANLARGFRAPNIFDLGTLGARPGNRFNIANSNLSPETVLTTELGMSYHDRNKTLDFVVWSSDYQDKIISLFTGATTDTGRDIVQSQNASTVKLHGAELTTRWQLNEHNEVRINVNFTRGETKIEGQDNEPADRIPPLNGLAAWRYEKDRWWLTTELGFADRQDRLSGRDASDPRINPEGTAGWGSLNLIWGFQPSEHWRVVTRAQNLLDRDYRQHGSGLDAAGQNIKFSIEGNF